MALTHPIKKIIVKICIIPLNNNSFVLSLYLQVFPHPIATIMVPIPGKNIFKNKII
jgi:hypothetical protein